MLYKNVAEPSAWGNRVLGCRASGICRLSSSKYGDRAPIFYLHGVDYKRWLRNLRATGSSRFVNVLASDGCIVSLRVLRVQYRDLGYQRLEFRV